MTPVSRELRFALVLEAVDRLRTSGSWCGETHLQKTVFALETLSTVPLFYEFIMYKHGPFSFDLRDDIAGLRAARLVDFELPQQGYGPRLKPVETAKKILERNSQEIKKADKALRFVTDWFGKKDVKELEKLATALFVATRFESLSRSQMVSKIRDLKPHIPSNDADRAISIVEEKISEAKKLKLS